LDIHCWREKKGEEKQEKQVVLPVALVVEGSY
jgi:hypothetical protein